MSPVTNLQRLEKLEAIVAAQADRIEKLERVIAAIGAVFTGGGEESADDAELDSRYGNPAVKKDPTERFWKGPSFVNRKLSECSPEYLDAFAKYKDLCAKLKEKEGTEAKKKYAAYDRADAARARGWARRIRAGWIPPAAPSEPENPFGREDSGGDSGGGFDEQENPFASNGGGYGNGASDMSGDKFPFGANADEDGPL